MGEGGGAFDLPSTRETDEIYFCRLLRDFRFNGIEAKRPRSLLPIVVDVASSRLFISKSKV